MGLLDSVLGGILGGSGGGSSSPIGGVLSSLLGGGQGSSGMAGQNAQNLGGQAQGGSLGGMGGIGGLVSQFERSGLGGVVQSWIGSGPNQEVSPQQLQGVLGDNQVRSMASQAGMHENDFLSQLSQHLPRAVDGMTPNGKVDDEGTMSV